MCVSVCVGEEFCPDTDSVSRASMSELGLTSPSTHWSFQRQWVFPVKRQPNQSNQEEMREMRKYPNTIKQYRDKTQNNSEINLG